MKLGIWYYLIIYSSTIIRSNRLSKASIELSVLIYLYRHSWVLIFVEAALRALIDVIDGLAPYDVIPPLQYYSFNGIIRKCAWSIWKEEVKKTKGWTGWENVIIKRVINKSIDSRTRDSRSKEFYIIQPLCSWTTSCN